MPHGLKFASLVGELPQASIPFRQGPRSAILGLYFFSFQFLSLDNLGMLVYPSRPEPVSELSLPRAQARFWAIKSLALGALVLAVISAFNHPSAPFKIKDSFGSGNDGTVQGPVVAFSPSNPF